MGGKDHPFLCNLIVVNKLNVLHSVYLKVSLADACTVAKKCFLLFNTTPLAGGGLAGSLLVYCKQSNEIT